MALTTITTVGYGEILPMSKAARAWNIGYVIVGVSTMIVSLGALTQTVVELELSGYFARRRNRRMIDQFGESLHHLRLWPRGAGGGGRTRSVGRPVL
jgi:voltage-gated potassium channel